MIFRSSFLMSLCHFEDFEGETCTQLHRGCHNVRACVCALNAEQEGACVCVRTHAALQRVLQAMEKQVAVRGEELVDGGDTKDAALVDVQQQPQLQPTNGTLQG